MVPTTYSAFVYVPTNGYVSTVNMGYAFATRINSDGSIYARIAGHFGGVVSGVGSPANNDFLNNWVNITVTQFNRTTILYVNGNYIGTDYGNEGVTTELATEGDPNIQIGNIQHLTVALGSVGKIGSVRIYDRLLTNQEVLDIYNADKGDFGL